MADKGAQVNIPVPGVGMIESPCRYTLWEVSKAYRPQGIQLSDVVEQVSEDGFPVDLSSGAHFTVLTTSEVEYVKDRVKKYHEEFKWQNVSDLQDVDQIVMMELFMYRWGLWISKTKDYFDEPVEEQALRKSMNDYSGEVRLKKKQLGMDKASRDKERGEDSVAHYLEQLRQRAAQFGVNRNKMVDRGITLSQQLIALYQLHQNCDEQERVEQSCTGEDILAWIKTTFIPEFQEVDEEFRKTTQRYWVADQ